MKTRCFGRASHLPILCNEEWGRGSQTSADPKGAPTQKENCQFDLISLTLAGDGRFHRHNAIDECQRDLGAGECYNEVRTVQTDPSFPSASISTLIPMFLINPRIAMVQVDS